MTHTTELERPAWGVWVDYKIAPPGSYACLVSRFMDNRWTDPEPQWMPAQLRPQLYGEVKVMPYLMPNDPLAAVNALPGLLDEVERLRAGKPMLIDADERTTVRIFTPYETDVPAQNEIIIGNFKLRTGRAPGVIWIETAGGEGGDFPIADIEALIREYYYANF